MSFKLCSLFDRAAATDRDRRALLTTSGGGKSGAERRRQQRRHDETPKERGGERWRPRRRRRRRRIVYVSASRHDGCGTREVRTATAIDRWRPILRAHMTTQPRSN